MDAAWAVAREQGIAAVTLREVATRVGMRPPSLYSHFDSKHAIYDAMFGQAWQDFDDSVAAVELPDDPRAALHTLTRHYVTFSLEDLARHQLMDQRVIPDFTPTPENYAPAVRALERVRRALEQITGGLDDDDMDLIVVVTGGLVGAQWQNDPGGTRYVRQLDRIVDLLADELDLPTTRPSEETRRP
nr:TetR/AcrR family transcriptional regulator [Pseudonocardia sp. C8]